MACSNLTMWVPSKPDPTSSSLSFRAVLNPLQPSSSSPAPSSAVRPSSSAVQCGLRELRGRIESVKNTQKITEAMKLVAAAKVRRAQEAVVNGRPFSETLVEVLYSINEQLQTEDVDVPLTNVRPVKKVALVVVTGDRGLCGGFNNQIIKKAESRIAELKTLGLDYTVISVGKKGNTYFLRRPYIPLDRTLEGGSLPTAKEAQAIADDVFSLFVSEEVDKVELLYTKFVSLVKSDPVIHTLLPLRDLRHQRGVRGRGGGRVLPADDEGGEADGGEGRGEDGDGGVLADTRVRAGPGADTRRPPASLPQQPDTEGPPGVAGQRAGGEDERHEQRHRQRRRAQEVPLHRLQPPAPGQDHRRDPRDRRRRQRLDIDLEDTTIYMSIFALFSEPRG